VKKLTSPRSLALALLGAALLIVGGSTPAVTAPLNHPALSFGTGSDVGATTGHVHAVVAGDLDNDGDDDLVSSDATGAVIAWQNDGTSFSGLWPSRQMGTVFHPVRALALGDLDHDGNLDVVSGGDDAALAEVLVWQNDGTPFDSSWTGNLAGFAASVQTVAVGDLDRDGYLDIVSGDVGAVIGAWRNDGSPFSGNWTGYQMVGNTTDPTHSLVVGDLNSDGYLDVASGDAHDRILVWTNDGTPFSGGWTSNQVGTGKDTFDALAVADLDGDGDLDLVSDYEYPNDTDYGVAAWQNDGSPWVGVWSVTQIGATGDAVRAVSVGDLNTDGHPDVIAGAGSGGSTEVMAWYSPEATFADPWTQEAVGASSDDVLTIALADLDHDGDLDAASGSGTGEDYELVAWENTNTREAFGSWVELVQPAPIRESLAVSLADFDHDGATDIAAGAAGHGVFVWLGDGGTTWVRVGDTHLPGSGSWRAVAWGQINNLLDVDLVAASSTGGLRAWHVWESGGDLDDRSTGLPTSGDFYGVALGDIDHDGWLDLVGCGDNLGVVVWRGNGTSWDLKTPLSSGQSFCDLRLGHVDHDGDLDIVAAHCGGGGVRVWRGDGSFGFTSATQPSASSSYGAAALGDVNRDGYADVAAALDEGGVHLWAGNGGTAWTSLTGLSDPSTVYSLDLADFDADGLLDLLATSKEGLRVWQGDGGVSWTSVSSGLPTSGTFYDADFARVDGDAALDIVAAEIATTGVRVWTAFEPPPGGWANFQPATWLPVVWVTDQVITATIQVADAGSGLDVSTAEYRFSRNGGASWVSGWYIASCTGSDGTTDLQTITAASVPFNQDSGTQNVIQFAITDMEGLTGTSDLYSVAIDSTAPSNPSDVVSSSHSEDAWSNDVSIDFDWADSGFDGTSGVRYYSVGLTQVADGRPDEVPDYVGPGPFGVTRNATSDGSWYFHLMSQDRAGNWSDPMHLGPYRIDSGPPAAPALVGSSHTIGGWSNDNTIWVSWNSSDGSGSGVAGYSWLWEDHPTHYVDTTLDTTDSFTTSAPLSDDAWYLHLRAIDQGGNYSDIAHLGFFGVDSIDPHSCWIDAPRETTNLSFDVQWSYYDATSGVASYDVQVLDDAVGTWTDWEMGTSDVSATYTGAQRLHTYTFRVRARDEAGNLTGYDCQDYTIVVEDLEATGLEVTQAIQNLANEMPLVQDKETYVRVYARTSWIDVAHVDAVLHGTRDGTALPGSPLSPGRGRITIQTDGGDRDALDDAFYFELPPNWRSGTVLLEAHVDPADEIPDVSEADNHRSQWVTFRHVWPVQLRMVRAHRPVSTYSIDDPDFDDILESFQRIWPINEVDIVRRGTIYPQWHHMAPCGSPSIEWNYADDGWDWTLAQVGWFALWDGSWGAVAGLSSRHWYAMVEPDPGNLSAGIAYRLPWDAQEAVGAMNSRTGASWWMQPVGGWTMAHELLHNRTRRHADCTGDEAEGGELDPHWPYPSGCQIAHDDPDGYYGFFMPLSVTGITAPQVFTPTEVGALMSYSNTRWISEHNYRYLVEDFSIASQVSPQDLQPEQSTQPGDYLAVSGVVTPSQGTGSLILSYRMSDISPEASNTSPQGPSALADELSLVLEDAGGQALHTHDFDVTTSYPDPGGSERRFFLELLPDDTEVARVVLMRDTTELDERLVSAQSPEVTLLYPNGGESFDEAMSIAWSGSDGDGDDIFYSLQYSPDNGQTWQAVTVNLGDTGIDLDTLEDLPGSDEALIRVIATDGINTSTDESDAVFSVARHSPNAGILEPSTGRVYGSGEIVKLRGYGRDTEDGSMDHEALSWTSDLDGVLGAGRELWVSDLVTGTHHITLTATDSDGLSGTDETTVIVSAMPEWVFLPAILKSYP
jgi:hypothetical protein